MVYLPEMLTFTTSNHAFSHIRWSICSETLKFTTSIYALGQIRWANLNESTRCTPWQTTTSRVRPGIRIFHLVAALMQNLAEDIGSLFLQHLCQRVVGRIDDGLRIRADFKQFTDQAVRLVQDPVGFRHSPDLVALDVDLARLKLRVGERRDQPAVPIETVRVDFLDRKSVV